MKLHPIRQVDEVQCIVELIVAELLPYPPEADGVALEQGKHVGGVGGVDTEAESIRVGEDDFLTLQGGEAGRIPERGCRIVGKRGDCAAQPDGPCGRDKRWPIGVG